MPHVYAYYKLSLIHLFARCESFRNPPRAQSQCTDIVVNGRVYFIINTSRTRVSIFVSMIYYRAAHHDVQSYDNIIDCTRI